MQDAVRTTLLEGQRTNLLPPAEILVRLLERRGTIISIAERSALGDAPTLELALSRAKAARIDIPATVAASAMDYTFSIYLWTHGDENLDAIIGVQGAGERTLRHSVVTRTPTRLEVSHRFGLPPQDLAACLTLSPAEGATTDGRVFISLPVLEEGLFSSTPIPLASTRADELLSIERAGRFFEGSEGTVSVTFIPSWSGSDLSDNASPCVFSCFDEEGRNSISIFASGERWGRLTALVVNRGVGTILESTVVPLKSAPHAVAIRWAGGIADFLVDGWLTGSSEGTHLPEPGSLGSQVFIGSDPRIERSGLFGGLLSIESYDKWLDDRSLQMLLFEQNPRLFAQFRNVRARNNIAQLSYLVADSWVMPIVRNLLRYPDLWQKHPPPWLLDVGGTLEEQFRDELTRSLGGAGFDTNPEAHSVEGRTDLLVRSAENSLRLECKVWGRHDYNDVPKKPLKYMTVSDRVAAVLMINANKSNIGASYRSNVLASDTKCIEIVDNPFGELMPDHFVSLHDADPHVIEVLHVVFDKYGPFGTERDVEEKIDAAIAKPNRPTPELLPSRTSR